MNKQKMIAAEIDVAEGLNRFGGMEKIYKKYLLKFEEDSSFIRMTNAMEEKDYKTAFSEAHTLKGLAGNLSINELYKKLCVFVDALRDNSNVNEAIRLYPDIIKCYEESIACIRDSVNQEGENDL